MEKRNYPIERKEAPKWECPICNKILSTRGKAGHLEKVHNLGKINVSDDLLLRIAPPAVLRRRPLARNDVRTLISNIYSLLIEGTKQPNIVEIRKNLLRCEFLIRHLEISFNCSLEEAWEKFRITKDELVVFRNKQS